MEADTESTVMQGTKTNAGELPLTWEQCGDPRVRESPPLRPTQTDRLWPTSQIDSLLSASSYPFPDAAPVHGQESSGPVPLYAGLLVDHESHDTTSHPDDGTASSDQSRTSGIQHQNEASREPVRKRGRPRKLPDAARGEDPEERRRLQVRMAQRAYRSRKEASISALRGRVAQLETAVRQMRTAVISFGDELVRSGALGSHPELLKPLSYTVQTCLTLPALPDSGDSDHHSEGEIASPTLQQSSQLPHIGTNAAPAHGLPTVPRNATWSLYTTPSSSGSSEKVNTMEISEFIERLHVTCRYQAYILCANPAVPMRRLERPFRMLLSIMPRESIAEYFRDWLIARASHKPLHQWDHIPFFCIGGAGTHYPGSRDNYFPERPVLPHETWSKIEDVSTQFPSDIEDIDDEWFDLRDLEGYLREKQVVLPASAPPDIKIGHLEKTGPLAHTAANISRLIQALTSRGMCLGRSPGFKRRDVESALEDFRNSSLTLVAVT